MGLTIIEGVPIIRDAITRIYNKISFQKMTHYGTDFLVKDKNQPSNLVSKSHWPVVLQ